MNEGVLEIPIEEQVVKVEADPRDDLAEDIEFYRGLTAPSATTFEEIMYMRKNKIGVLSRLDHIMVKHGDELSTIFETKEPGDIMHNLAEKARAADKSFRHTNNNLVYYEEESGVVVVVRDKPQKEGEKVPPPAYIVTGYKADDPNYYNRLESKYKKAA